MAKAKNTDPANKGEILRKAREEKGLSLEMVHEATNIPIDVLKGIEEGYTVRTLSPFYYKGFVKLYAAYVGVNPEEVLGESRKETLPKYIKKDIEEFDLGEWLNGLLTRRQKQQIVLVAGGILAIVVLWKSVAFVAGLFHREPPPKTERSSVRPRVSASERPIRKPKVTPKSNKVTAVAPKSRAAVKKKKVSIPPVREKKVVPKSSSARRTVVRTAASQPAVKKTAASRKTNLKGTTEQKQEVKPVVLTVRAKKSCWLRVKADGVIVFQSKLRIGAVETWMANESIEISGRNIHQLEFELNGKMIGSLGRKDRAAKRLVVTKDGLRVMK